MTFPEFVQEVAVGLAVVIMVFCAACIVVILLRMLDELVGWISQQHVVCALRCRRRGHGWFTVTVGQFDVPESYTRCRVCACCGHREELTP